MLELYHYGDSICSLKVRLCLAEKGLDWTGHYVDLLRFEQLRPEYLALNPNGVVPTLIHEGRVIIESTVINEYLDEVFTDQPLCPADPYARAQMRTWIKFEDEVLHPAVRPITFNLMLKPLVAGMAEAELAEINAKHPKPEVADDWRRAATAPVDHDAIAASRQKLAAGCDRLAAALADQPWLAGQHYSLAEVALVPIVDRLEHLGLAELWRERPALAGWVARLKARPAYDQAMPGSGQRLAVVPPGPIDSA